MSELLTHQTSDVITTDERFFAERDARLHELLGTDYDFARDSGLIDMFYVDPKTGEDGLVHMLQGNTLEGDGGAAIPGGFHHEPSAASTQTFVDRNHIQGQGKNYRSDFRENRYEPYKARTVIDGYEKESKSSMFPLEYDALAVLQAVKQARDTRDVGEDKVLPDGTKVGEGKAILLDGKSDMEVRLIFAPEDGRLLSAFPTRVRKNVMGLGRRALPGGAETGGKDKEEIDKLLGLQ